MLSWIVEFYQIDLYHFFAYFALYSMLGWLVESIYMSFCNRKITNRGFGKGPFCPIYGVGAMGAFFLFTPFKGRYLLIYVSGCIVATIFEYIVGRLMIHFLGELWWDYNEKPFNFQGIICLESTLAWGIYALIIVHILHGRIGKLIDQVDKRMGILMLFVLYFLVFIDYMVQLSHIFGWPKIVTFGKKITNTVKNTVRGAGRIENSADRAAESSGEGSAENVADGADNPESSEGQNNQ